MGHLYIDSRGGGGDGDTSDLPLQRLSAQAAQATVGTGGRQPSLTLTLGGGQPQHSRSETGRFRGCVNAYRRLSDFYQAIRVKRAKFIDLSCKIREDFHFAHPLDIINAVEIYETAFYGSSLWNLNSEHKRS